MSIAFTTVGPIFLPALSDINSSLIKEGRGQPKRMTNVDQNSTMTRSASASVWIGNATENKVQVQPLSEPDVDQARCLQ